jgi:hypothetical protein
VSFQSTIGTRFLAGDLHATGRVIKVARPAFYTGFAILLHLALLAAMPPADRKAWEALWRDVDAVLASVSLQAGPPSAKQC